LSAVTKYIVVYNRCVVTQLRRCLHKIHFGLYTETVTEIELHKAPQLVIIIKTLLIRFTGDLIYVHSRLGPEAKKIFVLEISIFFLCERNSSEKKQCNGEKFHTWIF